MADPDVRPSRPRLWLARVLALLVVLALPVALLSAWAEVTVADTDHYVDTVAPLADDEAVQGAVQERLEIAALRALARQHPALADTASTMLRPMVVEVVASDAFPPLWAAANRSAHESMLALLEDTDGGDDRVAVDLGPVVDTVWTGLSDEGLPVGGDGPDLSVSFTLLQVSELEKARTAYAVLETLGLWFPALVALLALVALVISPRRRGVLAILGWGALVVAGVMFVALRVARGQLVDGVRATDADLAAAVFDQVATDLDLWILVTAGVGLLLVLVHAATGRLGRSGTA